MQRPELTSSGARLHPLLLLPLLLLELLQLLQLLLVLVRPYLGRVPGVPHYLWLWMAMLDHYHYSLSLWHFTTPNGQVKVCRKLRARNSTTIQLGSLMLRNHREDGSMEKKKDHLSTNIQHNWSELFGKISLWKELIHFDFQAVWTDESVWGFAQQKWHEITVKATGVDSEFGTVRDFFFIPHHLPKAVPKCCPCFFIDPPVTDGWEELPWPPTATSRVWRRTLQHVPWWNSIFLYTAWTDILHWSPIHEKQQNMHKDHKE